jgi:hypothetical protein
LTTGVEPEPAASVGVQTNHLPNNPSPLVWPGALSPENVYRRWPLYATWLPLAVGTTLNAPGSVAALVGAPAPVESKGGQFCAHEAVQADFVAESAVK